MALPDNFVRNREIGATSNEPIEDHKLQHLYKDTSDLGFDVNNSAETRQVGSPAKVGATAGWVVETNDNLGVPARLPAGQTNSTVVIRLNGLRIGSVISAFRINAQIESAGGTVTLDAQLRKISNAAGDPVDALVASMTQVSVTADTAVAQLKDAFEQVVTAGDTYYLLITGTTAGATDIQLLAPEITVGGLFTKEVIRFRAEKAGQLIEAGAGLNDDGTNTSITFDVRKLSASPVSMLTAPISITHATGDRVEVAGTISGANGSYNVGDVISVLMTVTSAVGAKGPWVRLVRRENGD